MVEPFLNIVVTIMDTINVKGYNKKSVVAKLLSNVLIDTLLVDEPDASTLETLKETTAHQEVHLIGFLIVEHFSNVFSRN